MALRIGSKIHRFLGQNKFIFLVHESTRNASSKPKNTIPPLRKAKSSSDTNLTEKKQENTRPVLLSHRERDQNASRYDKDRFGNNLQPAAMPEYLNTTPRTDIPNYPDKSDLARKRFSKSGTHNALTKPLKLPLMANPFPEEFKTYPSERVPDDEKARLIYEEMKRLNKFTLKPSKEAANRYPKHRYRQSKLHPAAATENKTDEAQMESKDKQAPKKPESKPQTRASRNQKTPRHIKPTNQQRKFSSVSDTLNPLILSDLEHCEIIWEYLRAHYPEYRDYKKPFFMPGSPEEREFIQYTYRCLAKHRQNTLSAKRAIAPFPSYSEVKTCVREPCRPSTKTASSSEGAQKCSRDNLRKTRSYSTTLEPTNNSLQEPVQQGKVAESTETAPNDLVKGSTNTKSPTEQAQQSSRCFSTKPKSCKPDKKQKPTCGPMKSEGCADPNPNKCEYVHEKTTCKKIKAPYPSYSECVREMYEEEPSECKTCPWSGSANPATGDNSSTGKKKFSTFTAQHFTLSATMNIVERIKGWLNLWRPDSENIQITQSSDMFVGRETYIIEIQDTGDQQHPDITPLLACNDVAKNKPKKDALNYSSIQTNDDLIINQHDANDQTENVPFRLKPQFWRV